MKQHHGNRWKMNGIRRNTQISGFQFPARRASIFLPFSKLNFIPWNVGSLIVLHGSLVHMSEKNKSNVSRHAYTIHVIGIINLLEISVIYSNIFQTRMQNGPQIIGMLDVPIVC